MDFFANTYPDTLESTIHIGHQTTGTFIKFNNRGSHLAVGCYDGRVLIFDFFTKQVVRNLDPQPFNAQEQTAKFDEYDHVIETQQFPPSTFERVYNITGHSALVTSISWFRSTKKTVSSAVDQTLIVYNLVSKNVEKVYKFWGNINRLEMHPFNNRYCLASFYLDYPQIIDLETDQRYTIHVNRFIHNSKKRYDSFTAKFTPDGSKIYVGNSIGEIFIFTITAMDEQGLKFEKIHEFNINGKNASLKQKLAAHIHAIQFSRRGSYFILNCNDKLKFFGTETHVQVEELRDVVNNSSFSYCLFSGLTELPTDDSWDSDFIVGASGTQIRMWQTDGGGNLQKLLEGPKEQIISIDWHPSRTLLLSSTDRGKIYVWARKRLENWSAFAPHFNEIQMNEMYLEKEDEFDDLERKQFEKLKDKQMKESEEISGVIDVLNLDEHPLDNDVSDDEYFPVADPIPDVEIRKLKKLKMETRQKELEIELAIRHKKKEEAAANAKKPRKPKRKRKTDEDDDSDDDGDDAYV